MRTYTIHQSEYATVNSLMTRSADTTGLGALLPSDAPIQPRSVDLLAAGWVGAEWVRAVANYQDDDSVGYASLADLEAAHEWTDAVCVDFEDRTE